MERDILKKSRVHLQQGTEMIYLYIKKNRSSFPVKKMRQVLQVSQSGDYRWL